MGLLASFLSALFSTAKDLLSKRLAFGMDGTTSTFTSFAYALPFYVIVLAIAIPLGYETVIVSASFLWFVFLRSVTDTFAEGMKMHALVHGDLSMVGIFFSISPLFLLVLSPIITKDIPSVPGVIGVLLVVFGSLAIVYRPSSVHWEGQRKGIVLAVGASFFFALNSCFDKLAMKEGQKPVLAGFAMTLLSALFILPLIVFRRDRIETMRAHHGGLLARGLLEVAFMVYKLTAMVHLQAPYVGALQRVSLVLSIIAGRFFFREPDFARRLAAGTLILAGVLVIVWIESGGLFPVPAPEPSVNE